ncbi:MAG: cytochrome d ubiquinol oxidase subunit II [Thermomicrobiales bacterium]
MPRPELWTDLAFINGAILLLGVVLYALLGGADFGGGIWDLLASGPRAADQRKVIASAIGPIWEANHVWLIFVIVLVFTVFPPVFAVLSVALYIPLSLALLGIVFRGAAFIFRTPARNVATGVGAWDRVFAVASTVTPVFFGMAAGAVASGNIRVENGAVVSDLWRTWLAPFPFVIGLLALATCAYLAAVYLTLETTGELQEDFRLRALGAGAAFALLAAIALVLARNGAPWIWHGLTSRAAVFALPLGIGFALLSGWAVWQRRYRLARTAAIVEVALLLIGWALAQYPYLVVPDLTFENSAASPAMLRAALVVFGIGALFLLPSLWFLYRVFKAELPGAVAVGYGPGQEPPRDL